MNVPDPAAPRTRRTSARPRRNDPARAGVAVGFLLSLAVAFAVGVPSTVGATPLPTPASGAPGTTLAPRSPEVRADAAYVMNRDTGEAIFARYPNTRRSVASTTKLMTGLLAAESGRLGETFTVSANAVAVGETSMLAATGERLTLRELAHGLMLPSGNDAAVAIAEALDGSVAAFSGRMNRRAHQLGMWDSQFANPHGLDHDRFYRPDHFSTARDMAVLGSAVGDNADIRQIAGTTSFEIPARDGRPARTFRNTLGALWWYPGLVAGKTGWTELAGQCRVVIAERGGMRLAVSLLGAPDDVRERRDLLDYGFASLQASQRASGSPGGVAVVPRGPDDFPAPSSDLLAAWERFWAAFVTKDGMVQVSPGRAEATASLQGDAMLHAAWFRDREAFDRLWDWTRTRLERSQPGGGSRPHDALFASRWAGGVVADWTNDAGADQRIAAALMIASRTWRDPTYAAAASDTLASVLEKSAISSNRLGIAFEPGLASGRATVVVSARSIVPAHMRSFAEGARQGVWHWLIDGSEAILRAVAGPASPVRRPGVPAGTWPSTFVVARQGLALSRGDETFAPASADLVAQVAIDARWRAGAGTASTAGGNHATRLATAVASGIASAPELDALPLRIRAPLGCVSLVDPRATLRFAPAVAEAVRAGDAATVLAGLTGRWCLEGGPPDWWRAYLEPPDWPTSRNDAVVPPTGVAPSPLSRGTGQRVGVEVIPWFHDDETGHVVAGPFAAFVAAHGGLGLLGAPLTDAFVDDGRRVQYFRGAILEEVATPDGPRVVPVSAGHARLVADGVATRPEAARKPGQGVTPGQRHVPSTGHALAGAFLKVHDGVGGLAAILGDPLTEELVVDGLLVQYFTGGRLEYVPGRAGIGGEPVRLTPVGYLEARDRGWIGASRGPGALTN